jgi:phosphoribosylformylglycinamidine (FGAM) synthase-like amidotransferase family enzyme
MCIGGLAQDGKYLNMLGLMPHPENLIHPLVGGTDGRSMFESMAR